ncbi:MAG: Uma2 family endonuclease [Cytophagales bacterium]
MSDILIKSKQRFRTPSRVIKKREDYLSLAKFLSLNLEGKATKYEWKNGKILLEQKMKKEERIIIDNICTLYMFSEKAKDGSRIMAEADIDLPSVNTYRKPDAVYFTRQQIVNPNVEPSVPYFVIEVNSKSNTVNDFEDKLNDYFKAGIKTVWLILPNHRKINVYNSTKNVEIKSGSDICQAHLENGDVFKMKVEEIFNDYTL